MLKKVLLLEDDARLANSLKRDFEDCGYQVVWIRSLKELDQLNDIFTHAVVDLRLSHGELGLDAISTMISRSPEIRIVVLSGYGSITTAVEAVKLGAIDYLTKPASFSEVENALSGIRVSPECEFKRRSLSDVEHEYIDFVLTRNHGNISQTAKDLGLHRQSLQRKLKKYK